MEQKEYKCNSQQALKLKEYMWEWRKRFEKFFIPTKEKDCWENHFRSGKPFEGMRLLEAYSQQGEHCGTRQYNTSIFLHEDPLLVIVLTYARGGGEKPISGGYLVGKGKDIQTLEDKFLAE